MGRSHSAGLLNSEVETTCGTKNVNQLLSRLYIKPLSLFLLSVNKDAILLHVRIPEALWKVKRRCDLFPGDLTPASGTCGKGGCSEAPGSFFFFFFYPWEAQLRFVLRSRELQTSVPYSVSPLLSLDVPGPPVMQQAQECAGMSLTCLVRG